VILYNHAFAGADKAGRITILLDGSDESHPRIVKRFPFPFSLYHADRLTRHPSIRIFSR
jgi:hypothetical protein